MKLIEVKKPTNKTEMVSHENLNVKSFQELVLYYLRERKTKQNFELRHLIITNTYEKKKEIQPIRRNFPLFPILIVRCLK